MPNREAHQVAGGAAGSILAGLWAARRSGRVDPAVTIGGLLGGLIGACIPDSLDPPDSPNHRGVGHSLALAGTIGAGCSTSLPILIANAVRTKEEVNAYVAQGLAVPLLVGLRRQLALIALGVALGVTAGVASHLVLDGETPDGIRLFNRKVRG